MQKVPEEPKSSDPSLRAGKECAKQRFQRYRCVYRGKPRPTRFWVLCRLTVLVKRGMVLCMPNEQDKEDFLCAAWIKPRLRRVPQRLMGTLLPPRCLLCGARGQAHIDLCLSCQRDIPRNSPCCLRCGLPLAVSGDTCGDCQRHPRPWHSAWAPFRYDWPLNLLETRFKFSASLASGRVLAKLWGEAARPPEPPDCIIPVPLHPKRLRRRGYNQALELARPLARTWGIELHPQGLQRRLHTAPQSELDAVARRRNLRGAFVVPKNIQLPDHIAVLDDVMTTGATLAECTRTLKRAGVKRVDVWALARAP